MAILFCWVQASSALAQASKKHIPANSGSTPTPTASPSPTPAYVVPDIVANVDGQTIHKSDLDRVAAVLLKDRGKTLQALTDAEKKTVYHAVLDDMITDRLVNHQAVNENVDPLAIEKRYSELKAQYPTTDGFDNEVQKSGQTPDQVRQNLRIQIAQQQWIEHQIADQINVTPEEVEKFYKDGPSERFDAPEMVRASQILIPVRRDDPPEEALAAENEINQLAARLKKGESFEEVAKAFSKDPNAKQTGGDLGYFSRERIMPEFAAAAFKMKVGEVSPPVRTQLGYHIIKVTDHKPAHNATLAEARPQITNYLAEEKRRAAVEKLVASLRESAKLEIFLP